MLVVYWCYISVSLVVFQELLNRHCMTMVQIDGEQNPGRGLGPGCVLRGGRGQI